MDIIRRLKPHHLRLISEIGRLQKLNLAAEAMAMSQPAASRILADIEDNAGAPLFFRHPRWMEPTPVGQAFLRHARVILAELENLEIEVQYLNIGQSGAVKVGSVTGPAMGFLMPAVRQVKAEAPDIDLTIEIGPSAQLVRGLKEGQFDFVIARLPPDYDSREFTIYPARSEKVAMVVRTAHPLADQPKVSLADMIEYEWVVQNRGFPVRQAVENAYLEIGTEVPENVYNSASLLVVLSLVTQGDVISPQSQEVADILTGEPLGANLTTLNLDQPIWVSPYFIIQNRNRQLPRAAERLMNEVLRRL